MRSRFHRLVPVLIGLMSLASAPEMGVAQDVRWYADCPECASRLGGSGVAGPYSSRAQCQEYVQRMRAEGFPFGACYSSSEAPPDLRATGPRLSFAGAVFFGTTLCVAAGGLTWMYYSDLDEDLRRRNGMAACAAGGLFWMALYALRVSQNGYEVGPVGFYGGPTSTPSGRLGLGMHMRVRW